MTLSAALLPILRAIVGRRNVLTGPSATRRYATGYRYGGGPVLAVVRPRTIVEQFHAFRACVEAGAIVIVQAANTGLTGGSTPDGVYDRPVVVINTIRLDSIHLIRGGAQVVCLAGATLHALERRLAPLGREPHSVIGSSCIGASVVGGVCNNSGGALIRRGPAYTELALFARVLEDGGVELINHLGLAIDAAPDEFLRRIEAGAFTDSDLTDPGVASTRDYDSRVRDVDAPTAARFNADPARLFEASGSAGRVMVLAVRLDTFPRDDHTATFYIGTRTPNALTRVRRTMLREMSVLPVSAEYIHRGAFDVAARYGKDVFVAIRRLGTARLPALFAFKDRLDRIGRRFGFLPSNLSDRFLQALSGLGGRHLPARMLVWRERFEHHLILKVAGDGVGEARAILSRLFPGDDGDVFECTPEEAQCAFLHRFAVAGAALRYRLMRGDRVGQIVALDIALRRNDDDWFEQLPPEIANAIDTTLYYGHFFCHVFHQDYVLRPGVDPVAVEHEMWRLLDARRARYPAEHNVGHLYPADEVLAAHYRTLDPTNTLNPGIGQTSRDRDWRSGYDCGRG